MGYNMGTGIYDDTGPNGWPNMNQAIDRGDWQAAANEITNSTRYGQGVGADGTEYPGVKQRAANNAALLSGNGENLYTEQARTGCQ